ncbi:MAG: hypothetical protein QOF53_1447 [Nocardioidaceae bacterium]|nr:hypothetical protein [Nocardioidaceae bacterium]
MPTEYTGQDVGRFGIARLAQPTYRRRSEDPADGGCSGRLTVTAAHGVEGTPMMVFVDGNHGRRLFLTRAEAADLASALQAAAGPTEDACRAEQVALRQIPPVAS